MRKVFLSMMGENQPVTNEQCSPVGQGTSRDNIEPVTKEQSFEVIEADEPATSSQESLVIIHKEDVLQPKEPAVPHILDNPVNLNEPVKIPVIPNNPVQIKKQPHAPVNYRFPVRDKLHPWTGCYDWESVTEPYKGPKALYFKCTLEHVQLFRNTSKYVWAEQPRVEYDAILGKMDIKTSNEIPENQPYAFYSVIARMGKTLILTPVFNEIVAHDRLDLRLVHMNHNSRDTLNVGEFNADEHPIGDIVCVTKLQKNKYHYGFAIPNYTPEDVSTPGGKHCWEVAEYHFTPRRIEHKVITAPYKQLRNKYLCVASGFKQVIEMPPHPKRFLDQMLSTTIFVPAMMPGQFLITLKKQALLIVSLLSPKIVTWNTYCPLVIHAESAPTYVLTMFSVYQEAFKYMNREEAYLTLKTAVEFGANGLLAIKDTVVDKNTYLSRISSSFTQYPYIYLRFIIIGSSSPPIEEQWNRATSVNIECEDSLQTFTAEILSAQTNWFELDVEARISMRVMDLKTFELIRYENLYITQRVERDFREIDFDVEEGSNADKLIQALYGGEPLPEIVLPSDAEQHLTVGKLRLLETQTRYVHMVADEKTIALIGSSSFGCGKTAAIAAAALHSLQKNPDKFQMITAITNSAVVAVIEKLMQLDPKVKIVRIISTSNANNLPIDQLSKFDLPKVIASLLKDLITTEDARCSMGEDLIQPKELLKQIMFYLRKHRLLKRESLQSEEMVKLYKSANHFREETILKFYMNIEKPTIIVGTVQSVLNAFGMPWRSYIKRIATIQIDEASTLPRETLLRMVTLFPNARYSLVGDYRQLAPYYENDASPLLINTAVSDTLRQCVNRNLLPSVFFNGVFRCRPEITELLGDLFYGSALTSFHIQSKTEIRMEDCPARHLCRLNEYPIVFVDTHNTSHFYNGTSMKNSDESKVAMNLARHLLNYVEKEDIAILCFYRAQMLDMRNFGENVGVYVGSVDSAQGREWPICIICTTRTGSFGESDFLINPNRVNVALSRSKHMVYLFGDVPALYNKGKWSVIIDKCEEERSVEPIRGFNRMISKV